MTDTMVDIALVLARILDWQKHRHTSCDPFVFVEDVDVDGAVLDE